MKTTLNEIRTHSPCQDGWENLLTHLGKTKADDARIRKLACDYALQVAHLWDMPPVVRQYLETQDESIRNAAWDAGHAGHTAARTARDAARAAVLPAVLPAAHSARAAVWAAAEDATLPTAQIAAEAAAKDAVRTVRAAQTKLFREMCEN